MHPSNPHLHVAKRCHLGVVIVPGQFVSVVVTKSTVQAHQFCVAFALEGVGQRYSPEVTLLIEVLKETSSEGGTIEPGDATVSRMQSDVAASIRGLGLEVFDGPPLPSPCSHSSLSFTFSWPFSLSEFL